MCGCVYVPAVLLTQLLVYSDSGDDIELASCPHGQASKECSMVASCSCELLSEGERRDLFLVSDAAPCIACFDTDQYNNV